MTPRDRELRDVRFGGRWTRRQAAKNGVLLRAIRALLFLVDRTPFAVLLSLGRVLGALLFVALSRGRERAREATRAWFSDPVAQGVARASFVRAGENLARCLLLRRSGIRARDMVDVPEAAQRTLTDALRNGRGVVFVSAHMGPFELLAALIAELGLAPAIVVRESYDPRLDPIVDAHRLARGVEVIHRGDRRAPLRIVRALRAGRPVGFLPDFGGEVPRVPAWFLGDDAGFPVGPQQLAARLGAEIVVGVLVPSEQPGPRPFRLSVERVCPHGDVEALTRRVAATLERAIVRTPSSAEHFPWMAWKGGGRLRIAGDEEKALGLSAICQCDRGTPWHEGNEAARA